MKKEEFPTFLNEQPTVIFGRTTRELLIIVCGLVAGYTAWGNISILLPGTGGTVLGITCAVLLTLLSIAVALISIASRPMEEWLFCWLTYTLMPKLYIYKPLEENREDPADEKSKNEQQSDTDNTADAIDED
ncbi:MAG TPA: DUF3487 family protein [Ktedonobacteraceae bacterium]|nr:DUF3487 family protein [Ktedonobacteraceae bacterium]